MFTKILSLIEPAQRNKFILLCFLFIVLGLLEIIGISSVIPFLNIISYSKIEQTDSLTQYIYTLVNPSSYQNFLVLSGLIVLVMILITNGMRILVLYLSSYFVWSNQADMAVMLLNKILDRPYEVFSNENSSDNTKDVLTETENFVTGLLQPLLFLISNSVIALSISLVVFLYNAEIGFLVLFIVTFIFGTFLLTVHRPLINRGKERLSATTTRFKVVDEALSGIKLIKLLRKEEYFASQLKKPSQEFASARSFQAFTRSLPRSIFEVVAFGAVVSMALYGIYAGYDIDGLIPLIGLFAFAGYRLLPSFSIMYQSISSLTFHSIVLDRLYEQRNTSPSAYKQGQIDTVKGNYSYSFKEVSYSYLSSDEFALKDININLKSPSTIGIIGTTGSGKSTFIDLLLGLSKPTEGIIELNDIDLQDYSPEFLADKIGYVPQEIYLTDDTIERNIALGTDKDNIDQDRVIKAAKLAELHDLIQKDLEQAYQTVVGQRGAKLSGGQVQRIGIARAIYNNPEVLILDEGTSNLDQTTESKIIRNLDQDSDIKLRIMVAHRLKAIKDCDRLYLFNDGKLEDSGSYDDLSSRNEIFKSMLKS